MRGRGFLDEFFFSKKKNKVGGAVLLRYFGEDEDGAGHEAEHVERLLVVVDGEDAPRKVGLELEVAAVGGVALHLHEEAHRRQLLLDAERLRQRRTVRQPNLDPGLFVIFGRGRRRDGGRRWNRRSGGGGGCSRGFGGLHLPGQFILNDNSVDEERERLGHRPDLT